MEIEILKPADIPCGHPGVAFDARRIPARKCRRCARFHGVCAVDYLEPCSFVRKEKSPAGRLLSGLRALLSIL